MRHYEERTYRNAQTYREAELFKIERVIEDAARVADEDARCGRDTGTCVLGAGICIDVVRKGTRHAVRRIVIPAPFQGNVGSYRACERALGLLKLAGIDAYWYDGRMD